MDPNELNEIANRLEAFNLWRRGDNDIPMPPPYEIGENIDRAIKAIRDYSARMQHTQD